MFEKLREHHLFLKFSKCSFAKTELEYLGHIISAAGVSTDPSKTTAMLACPVPTTITELQGFLGLTGYHRRFVRNYGILVKPLTQLLTKKQFTWTEAAQSAFLSLKQAMASIPVLGRPYFASPFIVETDACDQDIGAVLIQHNQPIAFLSKALGPTHRHLSIYEKELLV